MTAAPSRPLEHRLVVPEASGRARAAEILEGRYELPVIPDMVDARRILDIGAGIGAFAAWCHYLWPHAWIDCYERNEERAGYCSQNAPPGTRVHVEHVTRETVAGMPRADVVRVAGLSVVWLLHHYPHLDQVGCVIFEWRNDYDRLVAARHLTPIGLRPVGSRVDDLGHGCEVWLRTRAEHERASGLNIIIGDEAIVSDGMRPLAPRFVVGYPHTPWIPARVESMARLERELDIHESIVAARQFTEKAPNWKWSGDMWRWALAQCEATGASHFLSIQDDARVAPRFWQALRAMVIANPHAALGLEAVHPAGPAIAVRGLRWYSTCAWLIGVAYVLPVRFLRELLVWRDAQPSWRIRQTNEDTLINDFCGEHGHRVFHPVPTIVDHDVAIASTYENDLDTHRRPTVTWRDGARFGFTEADLERSDWWATGNSTRLALPREAV